MKRPAATANESGPTTDRRASAMTERNRYGQIIGAPVPDWTPRPVPCAGPIEGAFCRLEPLEAVRHADDLIEGFMAAPDDRDWTWWRNARPVDRAGYRHEIDLVAQHPDFVAYAVIDPASGRARGYAAYMGIDAENGSIEIGGINYTNALKRSRAGTEALFLLMRHAFDGLGYRRLEWQCHSLNLNSRAAALRLGFTLEGIFRQKMVTQDRNRDTAWHSILDTEWPPIKRAMLAWLDPGNFTENGTQCVSLAALREAGKADKAIE